jgi:MoaA/NifB/PqqE/SkfB family radical SAM enzyme
MCCENFFRYLEEANLLGMKVTVSTNGSLIDGAAARLMAPLVSYVGISIDGPREAHDEFRGNPGSFDAAVGAAELLASLGCRVGLRFTLARPLIPFLDDIFSLAESLPVSRICFYHFMPAGRGERDAALAPARGETDAAIWRVMEWADRVCASRPIEILTVGDASDGARLHEYLRRHGASRLERASSLLRSAASRTGVSGILSVRWDGVVFRNQFSWNRPLGNWREIGRIAREKPPLDETAPECAPCHWRARHICASRAAGFGRECGAFRRKGAGR